jgi:hypothetical protein
MKYFQMFVAAGLLLTPAFSQVTPAPERGATPGERGRSEATKDVDVTFGAIKEITAGQKVVVNVDNAMDKTYDLTDKSVSVKLAKGLKVGDAVKVTDREHDGKHMITIAKHSGGGVKHGDPGAKAEDKAKSGTK